MSVKLTFVKLASQGITVLCATASTPALASIAVVVAVCGLVYFSKSSMNNTY